MREDPGLDVDGISSIEERYGSRVVSVTFLPLGYDPNAAVYEVVSRDGTSYFLKVRFGPVHEPGLLVPRALIDLGVGNSPPADAIVGTVVPARRPPRYSAPCSTRS